MRFENQVVIVTGGASGIGKSISEAFLEKGAYLILIDKDVERSLKLKEKYGSKLDFYKTDLGNHESLQETIESILARYELIHHIVNNVGLFNGKGVTSSVEEWKKSFDVNIISNFLLVQGLHGKMVAKTSSIINIASISGIIAQEGYLIYNTMKGALITMTKCMALDLAKLGIRVNSISPGTVWTENNQFYIKKSHGLDKKGADVHPLFGGGNMLKRVALPNEIATTVLFLASESASFITAENLVVDGGFIQQ